MLRLARWILAVAWAVVPVAAQQVQGAGAGAEAAVRAVLTQQEADWNRGDLEAFAKGYKHSPDILFVGSSVRRGYDNMLATYREHYGTAEKRGTLTFTNVEVHPLDANFATVLGNFHLERTPAGGGNADGIYSLVFERTPEGWKIVLDHSTTLPPKRPAQ